MYSDSLSWNNELNKCNHNCQIENIGSSLNDGRYFLDSHTGDIILSATGLRPEATIANLCLGLMSVIFEPYNVKISEIHTICINEESSLDEFIIKILDMVLEIYFEHYLVLCNVEILNLKYKSNKKSVCLRLIGEKFDRNRHKSGCEVKAITRHGLSVNRDLSAINVLLDI